MTKIEQADRLFSKDGFLRGIIPATLAHCLLYTGIAYYSVGKLHTEFNGIALIAGVPAFVAIIYFLRYWFAAKKHAKLKNKFEARYVELVETGKIIITPFTVLLTGAPGSAAGRYFPDHETW